MKDNLFELVYEEDSTLGVWGISLVNTPAIEVMAMKFNKEDRNVSELRFSSEDKRILVSPILIPNQKVYRQDAGNGNEGYVFLSEETIFKLQQNFFKKNFQHNSSFEHKDKIEKGVFVFESWIVEDPQNDKSSALGFENIVKGTWMVSLKIEDESIWEDYVLTGKVQGVSIDAFLKPQEAILKTNFNKQFNMKKNLTALFKKAVAKRVAMNADLMEVKVSDELSYFASDLEVDTVVYDVDNNIVANAQFDFEGKTYFTGENGEITEVKEKDVEVEFSDEEIEAILEEVKEEIVVDYEAQMAELNAKIAELEAKLAIYEKVEEENIQLSKQTPAKPITTKFNKDIKPNPAQGVLGVIRGLK